MVISASASASAAAHRLGQRAGAGEQAGAGGRGERHRDLQLGIIVAAGALVGLGPAVVEHVFAARMGFQVAGRGAQKAPLGVLGQQVARLPAGAVADATRGFKRSQKIVRNKWVIELVLVLITAGGKLSSCVSLT